MISSDPFLLREVARILFAEQEAAMAGFAAVDKSCGLSAERDAARERFIVALRRLGSFLRTGEIPEDLRAPPADTRPGTPTADGLD